MLHWRDIQNGRILTEGPVLNLHATELTKKLETKEFECISTITLLETRRYSKASLKIVLNITAALDGEDGHLYDWHSDEGLYLLLYGKT